MVQLTLNLSLHQIVLSKVEFTLFCYYETYSRIKRIHTIYTLGLNVSYSPPLPPRSQLHQGLYRAMAAQGQAPAADSSMRGGCKRPSRGGAPGLQPWWPQRISGPGLHRPELRPPGNCADTGLISPDGKDWKEQRTWPQARETLGSRREPVPGFPAPGAPATQSSPTGRPPSHLSPEFGPPLHIKTQLRPHFPTPSSHQRGNPILP